MSSRPRQFIWWRRREAERARQTGSYLTSQRLRAIGIAVLVGGAGWMLFYWTLGSHRIEQLDEFARYLKGEDLYRKYEVARLTWDCEALRRQFAERYLADAGDRMARDGSTLVFLRPGLDRPDFDSWRATVRRQLAFGHVRKVEHDGILVPAMIVRLFTAFRFESGEHLASTKNEFSGKCRT